MAKRRYGQFCPMARALDVVGERWTLLIVRNLARGPRRYTDLREGLPGMASNLLGTRLRELEQAGIVQRDASDRADARAFYSLTPRGEELCEVVLAAARFGLPYLDFPSDDEPLLDEQLPEGLAALARPEELGRRELRIQYRLAEGDFVMRIAADGPPGARRRFLERATVGPGTTDAADATVTGSMLGLLLGRRGEADPATLAESGDLRVEGPRAEEVERLYGLSRPVRPG